MENSHDKNRENRQQKEVEMKSSNEHGNVNQKDILANQGSEEQKMKEKYISEVSKIEDAPGNGGKENNEG